MTQHTQYEMTDYNEAIYSVNLLLTSVYTQSMIISKTTYDYYC